MACTVCPVRSGGGHVMSEKQTGGGGVADVRDFVALSSRARQRGNVLHSAVEHLPAYLFGLGLFICGVVHL